MTTLYKVTKTDGRATHYPKFVWPLPNGKPGSWRKSTGDLVACSNGLHAILDPIDILKWIQEDCIVWEAEYRGKMVKSEQKVVVRELRLLKATKFDSACQRLFASDCADRSLKNIGDDVDKRSWNAVFVSRRHCVGLATDSELSAAESAAWSAARSAARSAAESAARSAAWSAAWSAARYAAWSAAWSAARYAAWSAAWSAAESAAESAEISWQRSRIMQYLEFGVDAAGMECEAWNATVDA